MSNAIGSVFGICNPGELLHDCISKLEIAAFRKGFPSVNRAHCSPGSTFTIPLILPILHVDHLCLLGNPCTKPTGVIDPESDWPPYSWEETGGMVGRLHNRTDFH